MTLTDSKDQKQALILTLILRKLMIFLQISSRTTASTMMMTTFSAVFSIVAKERMVNQVPIKEDLEVSVDSEDLVVFLLDQCLTMMIFSREWVE